MLLEEIHQIKDPAVQSARIEKKIQRVPGKNLKAFQTELFVSELETMRLELQEIAQTFLYRSYIFDRLQRRAYARFFFKIPGIKTILSIFIRIIDMINHERNSAFLRQNEVLQNLIGMLKQR